MELTAFIPSASVLFVAVVALVVGLVVADRQRNKRTETKILRVTLITFLTLGAMGIAALVMVLLSN